MRFHHAGIMIGFLLGSGAVALAQEGVWDITGEARYTARYEGRVVHGTLPFSLETTVASDGHYETTMPPCVGGDPPSVSSGRGTPGSNRFLRGAVGDGIRLYLTRCGSKGVRVHGIKVRQRPAEDPDAVAGAFAAAVRYTFESGRETEVVHATLRGEYLATRRAQ